MYRWRNRLAATGEGAAPEGPWLVEVHARAAQRTRYELRVGDVRVVVDDDVREETLARLLRVARSC
jgi:hypothetical protein